MKQLLRNISMSSTILKLCTVMVVTLVVVVAGGGQGAHHSTQNHHSGHTLATCHALGCTAHCSKRIDKFASAAATQPFAG
jgi:hypothetical protein